ncbi:MAG TPA: ribonuclease T2 [Methylomirabilota bacterium]|nr:ribonuclease T2 [Methylomirabilota bacterium]
MIWRLVLVLGLAMALAAGAAMAEDRPGDFDFYVLSLSWSPSYCEAEGGERGMQCDGSRPFAFVLHGLWPQHERGWPERCDVDGVEPTRREVDEMLAIMPSPGLVRHQWRKHGSCSGLDVDDYFALAADAYERVTIPPALRHLERHTMVSPNAVEAAFRAANPGVAADGIAVTCDDRRLREVRICLNRDLAFRGCPEVDRRACRRDRVVMPPVR